MVRYLEIENLSHRIGERLRARGLTLATAESCTGGGLGDAITDIAGSSDYYLGGVISYANSVKERALGVPGEMLAAHGAVSPQVAQAMAEGARRVIGSDLALSTTGVAGPGGGTAEKPIGLVYIALATPTGVEWRRFIWEGDRIANKRSSVQAALALLEEYLMRDAA